ncbi:MAG: cation:proton antiporter [Betaproteobacteria bacterium]|nr:cation:proton antiporter [Betaproteobacteria bacterium]
MVLILLSIAGILYFALQLEDRFKIPSPLGIISLSFFFHYFFHASPLFTSNPEDFAALVLFLLPVLLISDSLELTVQDLKENGLSLFYLSVVAVALSVLTAIFTADLIFADYHLSSAAVIILFAMVLATDPVSVVSIFSKFSLPHRLKILAEGESLFNDATALIIFAFIGLYALDGSDITLGYVSETSVIVILGSAVLGIFTGYIGLLVLKTTENRIAEILVILCTGYGAFEIAEHFYTLLNLFGGHSHMHLSGILSCIFATITVQHMMAKALDQDAKQLDVVEEAVQQEAQNKKPSRRLITSLLKRIKATVEERDRYIRTKEDIQLLAIIANTVLFVAMAEIVDIKLLWQYKVEILGMFLATTIIRAVMTGKFAIITNQTTKMTSVNFRWWGVLTFAGIKGGLSIVMLMMIPPTFEHLQMFQAVVIGVILLSTFIYSAILITIITKNKQAFTLEMEAEIKAHHQKN